ncbi:MAG: hypothetical protein ACYC7B_04570 [Burkholderiales bacterium]
MNEAAIALVIFLLGLAFAAGGYVFALAAARKQINGLGARVNREAAAAQKRYTRMCLALSHACAPDRRDELLKILLEENTD